MSDLILAIIRNEPICLGDYKDINAEYKDQTALISAVGNKDYKLVLDLIRHGANINQFTKDFGDTALCQAIRLCNVYMIKLLLENGADVNLQARAAHQTDDLFTALMQACISFYASKDIIQLLIQYGANPHLRNAYGKSALDIALANQLEPAIITMLEQAELDYMVDTQESEVVAV